MTSSSRKEGTGATDWIAYEMSAPISHRQGQCLIFTEEALGELDGLQGTTSLEKPFERGRIIHRRTALQLQPPITSRGSRKVWENNLAVVNRAKPENKVPTTQEVGKVYIIRPSPEYKRGGHNRSSRRGDPARKLRMNEWSLPSAGY